MSILLLDYKGNTQVGEKLTFFGALKELEEKITVKWGKPSTLKAYSADYSNTILPCIDDSKALADYTLDDFKKILRKIEGNRKKEKKKKPYTHTRMDHFAYLIERVVDIASKQGICDNVLWATDFRPLKVKLPSKDPLGSHYIQIRRTLTPEEKCKILDIIFKEPMQIGQQMALLLMCFLGLRNSEACAVSYSDIEEIPDHPGCHVLLIHKTMVGITNFVKSGGKTWNMYRKIPIPPLLYDFLMERKARIKELFEAQCSKQKTTYKPICVEDFPICCYGHNIFQHCSSPQVTDAGRTLFSRISFSSDIFYEAEEASGVDDSGLKNVKAPSAYLFRRDFCTRLYLTGLTEAQRQYLMGHKITDKRFSRKYFTNPDILWELYQAFLKCPVSPAQNHHKIAKKFTGSSVIMKNVNSGHIDLPAEEGKYIVRIISRQTCAPMQMTVTSDPEAQVSGRYWIQHSGNIPFPEIDISAICLERLKQAQKKLLSEESHCAEKNLGAPK